MKCPKNNFKNPSDSSFCSKCGTQLIPSKEIPFSQLETLQTSKLGATKTSRDLENY